MSLTSLHYERSSKRRGNVENCILVLPLSFSLFIFRSIDRSIYLSIYLSVGVYAGIFFAAHLEAFCILDRVARALKHLLYCGRFSTVDGSRFPLPNLEQQVGNCSKYTGRRRSLFARRKRRERSTTLRYPEESIHALSSQYSASTSLTNSRSLRIRTLG